MGIYLGNTELGGGGGGGTPVGAFLFQHTFNHYFYRWAGSVY